MGEKRVLIVDGCDGDPELEVLREVFEGLVDEVREGKIVGQRFPRGFQHPKKMPM